MGLILIQVNVSSNAVGTGMDLASILPQYITARRGSLILVAIALAICPWNLVNNPGTFITVIGSLGVFISPLIGIYIADYTVVRHQKYKVPDLYIGDRTSVYWYQYGFHWRAFLTWLSLIWVSIRKSDPFSLTFQGTNADSWICFSNRQLRDQSILGAHLSPVIPHW
jgi:NCS1 family nucleobase:cation symporter-1